jgi:hypothetical protein
VRFPLPPFLPPTRMVAEVSCTERQSTAQLGKGIFQPLPTVAQCSGLLDCLPRSSAHLPAYLACGLAIAITTHAPNCADSSGGPDGLAAQQRAAACAKHTLVEGPAESTAAVAWGAGSAAVRSWMARSGSEEAALEATRSLHHRRPPALVREGVLGCASDTANACHVTLGGDATGGGGGGADATPHCAALGPIVETAPLMCPGGWGEGSGRGFRVRGEGLEAGAGPCYYCKALLPLSAL